MNLSGGASPHADRRVREKQMAWVKVTDIAYGRLRAPDLDVMEEFLTRFGMHRSERAANAFYTRYRKGYRKGRSEIRRARLLRGASKTSLSPAAASACA